MPDIPDYQMVRKIGEGAYGEIWLGISVTGVHRAIKFIYRDKFEHERPYEREFNGIKQYEPVSREHEGLVDILHIGRNEEKGYFYYVMELADDQHTGQEIDPATYKPKTLRSELTARENLPIPECLEQGAHLARALAHLHACGLAHRDVKPANIIYVKGKPRLADIGLVKALDDSVSFAGTIGYVPLEGPGRPTGDVFSLGKVLYEMLTGMDRTEFPTLPDSFKDDTRPGLQKLNQIVFKACEHKPDKRYQKADQLAGDLEQLIGQDLTTSSAPAAGPLPVGKLVAAVAAVAIVIFGINQFKDLKGTGEEKPQPGGSAGEDKYAHLKKGLVAYYPFNGNAKDESGNGNQWSEVKGPTLTADRHGKEHSAYSFDGKDDYLLAKPVPFLSQMTFSAWVLPTHSNEVQWRVIWKSRGDKKNTFPGRWLGFWDAPNAHGEVGLTFHPGQKASQPKSLILEHDVKFNEWIHIVGSYDGEKSALYSNGQLVAQQSGTMDKFNVATEQFLISDGEHTFKGSIDDIRLYNRALSEEEVKELHEMEKPQPKTGASVGPKATTRGNFNLADLVEINGIYYHQETKKPVTGKITVIRNDPPPSEDKGDRIEFNLVNGIKHGRDRRWYFRGGGTEWNAHDVVYQMGEVIKYQRWWPYEVQSKSPQLRYFVWKGTSSPWQVKKERWNQDGTPTKEHAATLNPPGQTYNIADTVEKNGVYYPKNSDKALTGRIVIMMEGEFQTEINVTNGIRDGLYRYWDTDDGKVSSDTLEGESVYQSGELIRHRSFTASSSASYNDTDKYWAGSSYPYQKKLKGWNRDGTPVTPLNKGLVAYYPFNGNAKDESGNNKASELAGATLTTDRNGQKDGAYEFLRSGSYFRIKNTKQIKGISLWLNAYAKQLGKVESNGRYLTDWRTDKGGSGYVLTDTDKFRGDFAKFYLDGELIDPKEVAIPRDKWIHVYMEFTDGFVKEHSDLPASMLTLMSKFGQSEGLNGKLDDLRLYDRALSAEEIKELYNQEKPKSGLEKGLAAYYPFNGNATDESGNGNDGKVNGATSVADRHGKKDSAYQFDGVDDDIWVGQIKKISGSFEDQITISAWVKAASARTQEFTIIRKQSGQNRYDWGFIIEESSEVGFGMKTEDAQFGFKAPVRPSEIVDKWVHVMAVRDSTNMYVYLNGRKIGQKPISGKMTNRSHSFNIGSIDSRGLHFAKGQIDDVRIYNRVLSEEEVKELYNLEKPKEK